MSIVSELIEEAKTSPHLEAFKTIHTTDKIRIGAGLRNEDQQIFFIEAIIKTCTEAPVEPKTLHKMASTLENLEGKGYNLSCGGDSFYAVKNINREVLLAELEYIKQLTD